MTSSLGMQLQKKKLKIEFVDFWPGFTKADNYFYNLLAMEYDVELDGRNPDVLFFSCFGNINQHYNDRCIKIFYTAEVYGIPDFKNCDFAIGFEFMSDERYYRIPHWAFLINWFNRPYIKARDMSYLTPIEKLLLPNEELLRNKFCNFVYRHPQAERDHIFHEIKKYKHIDSGGRTLNNMGGWTVPGSHSAIEKIQFLSKYKFTIAGECASVPGYVTEKIVHAFSAGSIPIYWGSPEVTRDFNNKAFIFISDWKDVGEALDKIKEIDSSEKLYRETRRQPIFPNNEVPSQILPKNVLKFIKRAIGDDSDIL